MTTGYDGPLRGPDVGREGNDDKHERLGGRATLAAWILGSLLGWALVIVVILLIF